VTGSPEASARQLVASFAARAARHDAEATFPVANLDDLRATGLAGLTVPREHRGAGADPRQFVRVCALLAEGCPATALLYTMHAAALAQIGRDGRPEQRESLFREAVAGRLFGIAYSDAPSDEGTAGVGAIATEEGWVLRGRKSFVTGAGVLDGFVATVALPEGGEFKAVLPAAGSPGLAVRSTWDALGMRASASDDLIFADLALPHAARLGPASPAPDESFQPNGIFALGFAATSVGIAAAALAILRGELARRAEGDHGRLPQAVRFRLADVQCETAAAAALLDASAAALGARGEAATADVNAAKLFANRAAVTVVDRAMQAVGGRAYLRPHPLERLYRDARAGLLMRNTEDQCREEIARAALASD
jgi:alkylation response protein AidB-like acyl-CoA dehydrogenase